LPTEKGNQTMTRQQAIALAAKRAKRANDSRFAVLDCDGWEVTSEYGLAAYFSGCNNVIEVHPDGYTYYT
jgi:hypothetical protein